MRSSGSLIAGFVTYVGAHGRRWAWLVAAVAITIPARGASLVLAPGRAGHHRGRRLAQAPQPRPSAPPASACSSTPCSGTRRGPAAAVRALAVAAMAVLVVSGLRFLPHLGAQARVTGASS